MKHNAEQLHNALRRLVTQHGFDAVAADLATFTGVPKAMALLREGVVTSGYQAARQSHIHLTTLYNSPAWKAYQAELKATPTTKGASA